MTDSAEPAEKSSGLGTPASEVKIRPRSQRTVMRSLAFAINDDSVEMAAISHLAGRKHLLDLRKVYVPGNYSVSEQRNTFIADEIEAFLDKHKSRNVRIALTVSGAETAFRTFVMPRLGRKELESAVDYEVKKQLPFPAHDAFHDFRAIARLTKEKQSQVKISLLAATRRLIEGRLSIFDRLGLKVNHIYITPDVISQVLQYLPGFREDTNYALINIEQHRSQIAYYRGSNLEFYHYASLGSSFLSHRQDSKRFEDFAELLAGEIQNSLDYYTGQFSAHFTNRVYVYGDLAYADELVQLLSDHFGFEFTRFPAEHLTFIKNLGGELEYSLPVSLPVLAAAACDVKLANLLPKKHIVALKRRIVDRMAAAALSVLALLFLGDWAVGKYGLAANQAYLENLNQNIATFKSSAAYSTYNLLKQQIASNRSFVEATRETKSYFGPGLKELSNITPTPIRLTGVEYFSDQPVENLNLQGVVRSNSTPPEVILAEFVETLDDSPFYDGVSISRYKKKPTKNGFELEFSLVMREIQ